MLKLVTAIALTLCLSASLTACGGGEDDSNYIAAEFEEVPMAGSSISLVDSYVAQADGGAVTTLVQ